MAAPSSREPRPQAASSPRFLRSPCCPGPLHGALSATSEQASRELPPRRAHPGLHALLPQVAGGPLRGAPAPAGRVGSSTQEGVRPRSFSCFPGPPSPCGPAPGTALLDPERPVPGSVSRPPQSPLRSARRRQGSGQQLAPSLSACGVLVAPGEWGPGGGTLASVSPLRPAAVSPWGGGLGSASARAV